MPTQTISQSGFIRGLNASVGRTVQPKGSVPRLTNMLLTHRGTLITCDGTAAVALPANTLAATQLYAIGAFTPPNLPSFITALGNTSGRTLPAPGFSLTAGAYASVAITSVIRVNPTHGIVGTGSLVTVTTTAAHNLVSAGTLVNISGVSDSSFNGTFAVWTIPSTTTFTYVQAGTNASSIGGSVGAGSLASATQYFYEVVAVDSPLDPVSLQIGGIISAGHTLPAAEQSITPGGANNYVILTISMGFAAGALVYRSTTTGTEKLVTGYIPNTNPNGTVTAWDLGYTPAFPNISPPLTNTTVPTTLYSFSNATAGLNTYDATTAITDLPKLAINAVQPPLGGYDGNYPTFTSLGAQLSWTPYGGAQGALSPLSSFVPFLGTQILILGNGLPPMQFNGQTLTPLAGGAGTAPAGAAAAVVYAGSLWVGNTAPYDLPNGLDGPSALRMSNSNNPNSWTNANSAFLSKGDGTQVTGMAVFTIAESGIIPTGSLVVFKEYSTFQITGVFGASNFTIQQAQTDMGCIAPRTIQFVPGFGIVRLTHLGWAVFDGVRDRLLSEELRPYLFIDSSQSYLTSLLALDINSMDWGYAYRSRACQTFTPAMYVTAIPTILVTGGGARGTGQLQTGFAFDLVLKSWTNLNWWNGVTLAVNDMYTLRTGSTIPIALLADTAGSIHRWQGGDELWSIAGQVGQPVQWSVRTPDVIGKQPTDRLLIRRLLIRGTNLSSSTNAPGNFAIPTLTPVLDRVAQTPVTALLRSLPTGGQLPSGTGTEFEIDAGIAPDRVALATSCIISGTGTVELDSFDWTVIPRPASRPVQIS